MKRYRGGVAVNIFAGLVMLVPTMILLINMAELFADTKTFLQYSLLVCGFIFIFAFVENRRGYFRPGWILVQGFVQFFIGLSFVFLTQDQFTEERVSITFGLWALVTAASQISGGIQLHALEVKRWWLLPVEGLVNLAWAFFLLVNPFGSYDYIWLLSGMYMGSVSAGTVLEFFVHRR